MLYCPNFLDARDSAELFVSVSQETDWREETLRMFGRDVPVPRRCAWSGDEGLVYSYSRVAHRAPGWTSATARLGELLLARLNMRFNFVLLNMYRDGSDSMGWHADDEPSLGEYPCIASLSLGAARRFRLRSRGGPLQRVELLLEPGSLLVMWGNSQRNWQHALPRTRRPVGPRINLTFRRIISDGS